jgi:replication factor A1
MGQSCVPLRHGQHYVTAMLTSQLNHHVLDGTLQKFSVLRLKEYFSNAVQGRK